MYPPTLTEALRVNRSECRRVLQFEHVHHTKLQVTCAGISRGHDDHICLGICLGHQHIQSGGPDHQRRRIRFAHPGRSSGTVVHHQCLLRGLLSVCRALRSSRHSRARHHPHRPDQYYSQLDGKQGGHHEQAYRRVLPFGHPVRSCRRWGRQLLTVISPLINKYIL